MTENGSNESPMPSLLMGIYQKLASLEATSLANRQAMVDRTELIRREVVENIRSLKDDAWSRFQWVEDTIAANHTATDTRLRQVEIAHGLTPKPQSAMAAAMSWLLKAIPLYRLVSLALIALITAVMHAMPAEMHALVKPIVAPLLEYLKTAPK